MKCPECGEEMEPQDIPVWSEFRLFGQTWIFGRWKSVTPTKCWHCRADREREREQRIFDAGAEYGARKQAESGDRY